MAQSSGVVAGEGRCKEETSWRLEERRMTMAAQDLRHDHGRAGVYPSASPSKAASPLEGWRKHQEAGAPTLVTLAEQQVRSAGYQGWGWGHGGERRPVAPAD